MLVVSANLMSELKSHTEGSASFVFRSNGIASSGYVEASDLILYELFKNG